MKKILVKAKKIKFNGIGAKLVYSFAVQMIIALVFLNIVSTDIASKSLRKEAEKTLVDLSEVSASLTRSEMDVQRSTLEIIAQHPDVQSMSWLYQLPILKQHLDVTSFLDLGIMTPDGSLTYTNGNSVVIPESDPSRKALAGDKNTVNLNISPVTGELVLMYATPIEKDNEIVGALVGRMDGVTMSLITDQTGYGEKGYGYIIDANGTIVAHPNRELVMEQFNPIEAAKEDTSTEVLANFFEKVSSGGKGIDLYQFEGENLYSGYAPIEGTDWTFVITAYQNEVLESVPKMQSNLALLALITLIVNIIIIFFIGTAFTKPILKGIEYAKKVANLDLTEEISGKLLKRKDEIKDLIESLNGITRGLRNIIGEINSSSQLVSASSEELTATSEQVSISIDEVSRAINEIALGAADQAKNTEIGSQKAIDLGETFKENVYCLNTLIDATKKVTGAVDDGFKSIDALHEANQLNSSSYKKIKEIILKTNESAQKINEASDVIESIAKQTNLLSLNASIEAARAGEAGKGFAVVAGEIKVLADHSQKSVKEIEEILEELQINSQDAVITIEKMSEVERHQTESVEDSKNQYMVIENSMKDASKLVDHLHKTGLKMEQMKDDIMLTLENLTAIAEENSASTEETSASMEEQNASIEEIAHASEELSELAQNLQTIIGKFKL